MLYPLISSKLPVLLCVVAMMIFASSLRAEQRPDWVETGLAQKERIAEQNSSSETTGGSTSSIAYADRALPAIVNLPYWVFESGPFATVEEAKAVALRAAVKHLQYIVIHSADQYDGWFDLLNTGYTWDLPPQLVSSYAVADTFIEEKQHSLGNVSATMYQVYLKVPNDPKRLKVLMEHRRQTISRQRTWAMGLGFGVITWECFCLAIGLRVFQWTQGSWRGRIVAASIIGGTLPVLLLVA